MFKTIYDYLKYQVISFDQFNTITSFKRLYQEDSD